MVTVTDSATVHTGGVSLLNSGLIPVGNSSHAKENSINLQLFPTNQNAPDSFGPLASRPDKLGKLIVSICRDTYVCMYVPTYISYSSKLSWQKLL